MKTTEMDMVMLFSVAGILLNSFFISSYETELGLNIAILFLFIFSFTFLWSGYNQIVGDKDEKK
jgi:hypothetical protein